MCKWRAVLACQATHMDWHSNTHARTHTHYERGLSAVRVMVVPSSLFRKHSKPGHYLWAQFWKHKKTLLIFSLENRKKQKKKKQVGMGALWVTVLFYPISWHGFHNNTHVVGRQSKIELRTISSNTVKIMFYKVASLSSFIWIVAHWCLTRCFHLIHLLQSKRASVLRGACWMVEQLHKPPPRVTMSAVVGGEREGCVGQFL